VKYNTLPYYVEHRFILVSQAYDILSNPLKREIYDQYGEEGIQYGGAAPPCHSSFRRNAPSSAYQYNPHSIKDIYNEFFRENGFAKKKMILLREHRFALLKNCTMELL
jgi:DnaJ-class molecular chaperone